MLAIALGEHFFWITSRAAGTATLLLSSVAVAVGLLMGGKLLKKRGVDLRVAHEALSLATLVALVIHALALLGDGYLSPSLADVTIPFVRDFERLWMSIGIVAGWAWSCSASRSTPASASASDAGGRCTASPRWPGSWASCTR